MIVSVITAIIVASSVLIGCASNKGNTVSQEIDHEIDSLAEIRESGQIMYLNFLGERIEDSIYSPDYSKIKEQVYDICRNNSKLHWKNCGATGSTISIAGIDFRIRVENNVELIPTSALDPNSFDKVIKYLRRFYGKPQVNGPNIFLWKRWGNGQKKWNHFVRLEKSTAPTGSMRILFILEPDMEYFNAVCGHIERDTLKGAFVKGKEVRLWFECCDTAEHEVWQLCCSDPSIKPVKIWSIAPHLVDEGDLDGDGIRDFGFIDTWLTSSCREYNVLTIKGGNFQYMFELETALSLRTSGKDLVSATGEKGRVRVTYSNMEAPLSCCSWAPDTTEVRTVHLSDVDQSAFK